MREVNAVDLRKSVGEVARLLEETGEPILLKVGRKPVGVIVSLRDFNERFALQAAAVERRRLVEEILGSAIDTKVPIEEAIASGRRR